MKDHRIYRSLFACLLPLMAGTLAGCSKPGTESGQPAAAPGARIYRVGVASYAPDTSADRLLEGLFATLAKEGFVRGQNLEVDHKIAGGEMANIPMMLQSIDSQQPDLVITLTTPVLTGALMIVQSAPIVFCYVTDPIAAGAGTTFTEHLPNVTGVGSMDPIEESFDILAKLRPGLRAIGTLYNPSEANSVKVMTVARETAKARSIRLEETTINGTSDVLMAAQSLTLRNIDALWVATDNTAAQAYAAIGTTAKEARLPLVANEKEQIKAGALIAVGPSWKDVGEITAKKAARVLRGERPANIPFDNFVGATVVLNHELARQIGITFPPEIAVLDGKAMPKGAATP